MRSSGGREGPLDGTYFAMFFCRSVVLADNCLQLVIAAIEAGAVIAENLGTGAPARCEAIQSGNKCLGGEVGHQFNVDGAGVHATKDANVALCWPCETASCGLDEVKTGVVHGGERERG